MKLLTEHIYNRDQVGSRALDDHWSRLANRMGSEVMLRDYIDFRQSRGEISGFDYIFIRASQSDSLHDVADGRVPVAVCAFDETLRGLGAHPDWSGQLPAYMLAVMGCCALDIYRSDRFSVVSGLMKRGADPYDPIIMASICDIEIMSGLKVLQKQPRHDGDWLRWHVGHLASSGKSIPELGRGVIDQLSMVLAGVESISSSFGARRFLFDMGATYDDHLAFREDRRSALTPLEYYKHYQRKIID